MATEESCFSTVNKLFFGEIFRATRDGACKKLRMRAMKKIAVYPGTFDPFSLGHENIARRAACLFDELIIAIAQGHHKMPCFALEERLDLTQHILKDVENVRVLAFSGLLIDFLHYHHATIIIRGLRSVKDFDYENALAGLHHQINPDVETVFLSAEPAHAFTSSSIIREMAFLNGNITPLVRPIVLEKLRQKHHADLK